MPELTGYETEHEEASHSVAGWNESDEMEIAGR
jgi:hypothetical protein